jgi:hypothetical protein
MSTPVPITEMIRDDPYEWKSSYRTEIDDETVNIRVRIHLSPKDKVSLSDLLKIQRETEEAVNQYLNGKFSFIDEHEKSRALKIKPEFVSHDADLDVRVSKGNGRDTLDHWYSNSRPITRAHEIGHLLGLKDEYVDMATIHRSTPGASGVFKDHSLMGNFYGEGIAEASVKERHAKKIAATIALKAGIQFAVRSISPDLKIETAEPKMIERTGQSAWIPHNQEQMTETLITNPRFPDL